MTRPSPPPLRLMALAGLLLIASPALGQDRSEIRDEAAMFSKEATRKVQPDLAEIDRNFPVAVTVETIESLKGQDLNETAQRRAEKIDHKGIFVLIAVRDHKIQAIASREVREKLGPERLIAIRDAFNDQFKAGKLDEGLIRGVKAAATALGTVYPHQSRATFQPSLPEPSRPTPGSASTPRAEVGDSPLVVRHQVHLTLAGARKVLEGAEAKSAAMGVKSNIAVVDDGGHLIAFSRMDGGRPASAATSITKATSAATFRQASGPLPGGSMSDELLNLSIQAAATASGGKFTSLRGGLPIILDGQVIGAVGVGGGTGEQDTEVAKAGIDAFLAGLRETSKVGESQPQKPNEAKDAAAASRSGAVKESAPADAPPSEPK